MSPVMALCQESQAGGDVCVDHDEELVPLHSMYGTLDAEPQAQRTIKRAAFTAFLSPQGSGWSCNSPCRHERNH